VSLCELREDERSSFQDEQLGKEGAKEGRDGGQEYIKNHLRPLMNMNDVWSALLFPRVNHTNTDVCESVRIVCIQRRRVEKHMHVQTQEPRTQPL
jgi:hypothetical protein